ncbi:MAG: class I SAM-dependent methyltransferase [Thermodesulfobacterium sp.]|nr:class I SAM-dependent methyltransferase [Thermodesulfobacterium sp.]
MLFFNKATLFIYHRREKAILEVLASQGITDLSDKKILDVGCGYGGVLRRFVDYGALPKNLYGIDLLPDRIETAKKLSPHINLYVGSAIELLFENEFFNIVMQFTVFTSILDHSVKQKIAQEMLRVLKPDGIIIWYDYWISKPTNPDVKGVGEKRNKKNFSQIVILNFTESL